MLNTTAHVTITMLIKRATFSHLLQYNYKQSLSLKTLNPFSKTILGSPFVHFLELTLLQCFLVKADTFQFDFGNLSLKIKVLKVCYLKLYRTTLFKCITKGFILPFVFQLKTSCEQPNSFLWHTE